MTTPSGPPGITEAEQVLAAIETMADYDAATCERELQVYSPRSIASAAISITETEAGTPGPPGPPGPPGASNAAYAGEWAWTTKTADANTAGQTGINATTWAEATQININQQRGDNTDVTPYLQKIKVGDILHLRQKTDSARYGEYQITGAGIDNGTWWSWPVTHLESAGTIPNGSAGTIVTWLVEGATGGLPADITNPANTRLLADYLAAGDTQPAWRIYGNGKQEWGPGGTTAPDTNLYRTAAGLLKTDGNAAINGHLYADNADLGARLYFGAARDVDLYREAAGLLRTNSAFNTGPVKVNPGSSTQFWLHSNGTLYLGSGADTSIYRAAPSTLGITTPIGTRAIEVGAADSGGPGYRTLRVTN